MLIVFAKVSTHAIFGMAAVVVPNLTSTRGTLGTGATLSHELFLVRQVAVASAPDRLLRDVRANIEEQIV